ncbi:MAG: hypothetical protein KKB31_06030 [Nanoarchaeota archaeon]|nr:hypothetical protein [Nanoarchaeota archaeon]
MNLIVLVVCPKCKKKKLVKTSTGFGVCRSCGWRGEEFKQGKKPKWLEEGEVVK